MRMQEAMEIINRPEGFLVAFEVIERGPLRSDYFPDKNAGEALIPTEEEAWDLAEKFATSTVGKTCNVYVVNNEYKPVDTEICSRGSPTPRNVANGEYRNRRIYNRYPT